jgi:hypothetical protein
VASPLPTTGSGHGSATNAAPFAAAVGFALIVAARLRTNERYLDDRRNDQRVDRAP